MRLATSSKLTPVGNVRIHELFRVVELDAGCAVGSNNFDAPYGEMSDSKASHTNIPFSSETIQGIESRTAIVIPCKNEERGTLAGVLYGISNSSLIIIVSISEPSKFRDECELLAEFCKVAQRPGVAVHQHNTGLAKAFCMAGMSDIVNDISQAEADNLCIRNGKGEAMIIGVAIAKLAGKHFIGFIDADNQVAGAVQEYCKVYAAGLYYAIHCTNSVDAHAMVRIKWNSKPKVRDNQLVFEKSGRSSLVVNEWMNRLLQELAGNNQDNIIQTGNAGEHAMSLDLAMKLHFATAYAVEPFQLIDLWEQFGARMPEISSVEQLHTAIATIAANEGDFQDPRPCSPAITPALSPVFTPHSPESRVSTPPTPPDSRPVHIVQIETVNPHFHDSGKGEGHIEGMQVQGLSTIYHSALTPEKLKEELRAYMKDKFSETIGDGTPARMRAYPAMKNMDMDMFGKIVKETRALKIVGEWESNMAP